MHPFDRVRRGATACVLALALLIHPGDADAGPEIDPGTLVRYMGAQRSSVVATLRNLGDVTAFVQVELAEVFFDGNGEIQERPLAEQDGFERSLLVTPPRAIVAAGGAQKLRIIYRGGRETERYFRVRYVPVAPQAGDSFALQPDEAQAYADALRVGVGVLKGIGTLVIVPPEHPRFATRLEPGKTGLGIFNDGNATVRVDGARYCDLQMQACTLDAALHVRPGQNATIERRPGMAYRFELREGSRVTEHVYPEPS